MPKATSSSPGVPRYGTCPSRKDPYVRPRVPRDFDKPLRKGIKNKKMVLQLREILRQWSQDPERSVPPPPPPPLEKPPPVSSTVSSDPSAAAVSAAASSSSS